MPNFLTQCPFCQTSFKVTDEQMQAANGVVRCGACMEVFLAQQHRIILKDKAPAAAPPPPPEEPETGDTPLFGDEDSHHQPPLKVHEEKTSAAEEESPQIAFDTEGIEDLAEEIDTALDEIESATAGEDEEESLFTPWDDESEQFAPVETSPDEGNESAQDYLDEEPGEEDSGDPGSLTEPVQNVPEIPEYAGHLDPAGYRVESFNSDCELPAVEPDEETVHTPAAFVHSPEEDNQAGSVADFQENISEISGPGDATLNKDIPEEVGEDTEEPYNGGLAVPGETPGSTAIDQESPADDLELDVATLEPDLVAREHIPASLGAQTMAWFRSLRKFPGSQERALPGQQQDEKAVLRGSLAGLKNEDSLEPLDRNALSSFNGEPVELLAANDPYKTAKSLALLLTCILLILALAGQAAWFNLDNLVGNQRFAPLTSRLCAIVSCPDPERIDLSSLVTEELVVTDHPTVEDALLVNFIIRNNAAREQPFPDVELNFTDNSGRVIANRVFTATEYLPEEMQLFTYMPAHSSLQISLELVDPGDDATGYSLVLRNPR